MGRTSSERNGLAAGNKVQSETKRKIILDSVTLVG
jgi:hypothetical protein